MRNIIENCPPIRTMRSRAAAPLLIAALAASASAPASAPASASASAFRARSRARSRARARARARAAAFATPLPQLQPSGRGRRRGSGEVGASAGAGAGAGAGDTVGLGHPSSPPLLSVEERAEALRSLLDGAGLLPDADGLPAAPDELGRGFCNWVYRAELAGSGNDGAVVVVKVFSPLARVRVDRAVLGSVDVLASGAGIGPRILHRGPDGIVMSLVDGSVLTEQMVHDEAEGGGRGELLCRSIGAALAGLHCSPLPGEFGPSSPESESEGGGSGGNNMLWTTLDRMLGYVADADDASGFGSIPSAVLEAGWSHRALSEEVREMRDALEPLGLTSVLCHGDFKPSNIILGRRTGGGKGEEVVVIDYELSGPGYRGYDFCKLFRTGQAEQSRRNMRAFAEAYLGLLAEPGGAQEETIPPSKAEIDAVLAEMELFEPLTWLEAGIFFLFAARGDPSDQDKWVALALDRLGHYARSKDAFWSDGRLQRYKDAMQQMCSSAR